MTQPQPRSRILIVTRNLPPLVGGMERLNWHMAEELSRQAEIRVIGPQGSAQRAPGSVSVTEVPLRPLWKFLLWATWQTLRQARAWRPDVVLAGSGLTAPAAWLAARACGARAAVYVHGLDLVVDHPVYKALWRPVLRRMDCVIANSTPTRQLAEAIGISPERIGIVHPGVELPMLLSFRTPSSGDPQSSDSPPDESKPLQDSCAFRNHHDLGNGPLLLSVGRLSARKGLREFVTQALPAIVTNHPDVMLLVVGDAPSDALHAEAQTPESIRAVANSAGVAENLRFLGRVADDELARLYRMCDVHVFPIRPIPDNPEGFGMVAVEAAAHGLPTVAFACGGVVDAVAEGQSGQLVASGDYAALADAVIQTFTERDLMRAPCIAFAKQFAWTEFGSQVSAQLYLGSRTSPYSTPTQKTKA